MNSDYILNVLETVKFVFWLQIHALVKCTMNEKFCILHEAAGAEYIQLVRVFVNKTLTTVSNP